MAMKKTYTVKASTTAKKNNKKPVKAGAETLKDDDYIMGILRENEGLDEDDDSEDEDIIDYYDSNNEIFDLVCDYEGLVGYGETIRDWVFEIYGIDLNDYDD